MEEQFYEEQENEPKIISTSQAVNLTATIASLFSLCALFLCFADKRSRAIRRFSVQSVGIGVLELALGMVVWLLCILLGWIPIVGAVFKGLFITVLALALLFALVLRVRMMLSAYRGEAYVLPVIGEFLRRFE